MKKLHIPFLYIITITLNTNVFANTTDTIKNYTKSNIKSVTLKQSSKLRWSPMILLNREFLQLQFDDMNNYEVDYMYSITLCSYNWVDSDISKTEYLSNIEDNYITNIETSFNTPKRYTHYSLSIPNDDVNIILSGNYVLKVYREDTKEVVLVRRFIVYENKALISAKRVRTDHLNHYHSKQKIELEIALNGIETFNYSNIRTSIFKNYDWRDFRINRQPNTIFGSKLVYNSDVNSFDGGNEYRFFNSSSTRGISVRVDAIEREDGVYNFFIMADYPLKNETYYNSEDINGNFKINAINVEDFNTEAEYTYVHFELKSNELLNQDVYIYGGFNDWQLTPENKMHYDYDSSTYYISLSLKQGFYNYKYITKKKNSLNLNQIDGSFFETKNDYHILVYLNSPELSNHYRVIGYKLFR